MSRTLIAIIAGIAVAVFICTAGYRAGAAETKLDYETTRAIETNNAKAWEGSMDLYAARLSGQLDLSRQKNHDLLAKQREEVPHATTVFQSQPGGAFAALPDYHFTRYAVCLWNSAPGGMQADQGAGPTGAADAGTCAGAPDAFALSDITPGDALDNALVRASSCRDDRDTLAKDQAFLAKLAAGQ